MPLQSLIVLGAATLAIAGFYGVSHTVASERQALERTREDLDDTRADIRRLKTELGTRASLRQLERWNAEVLGLEVPTAGQFVTDAGALASLDRAGVKPGLSGGPPIMVEAMRRPEQVADAGPLPLPAVARPSATRSDVSVSQSVLDRRRERRDMMMDERARPKTVALASAKPKVVAPVVRADAARPKAVPTTAPEATAANPAPRAERLAAMERRLAAAVAQ